MKRVNLDPIVECQDWELKEHQIKYSENGGKITLSKLNNGIVESITGKDYLVISTTLLALGSGTIDSSIYDEETLISAPLAMSSYVGLARSSKGNLKIGSALVNIVNELPSIIMLRAGTAELDVTSLDADNLDAQLLILDASELKLKTSTNAMLLSEDSLVDVTE